VLLGRRAGGACHGLGGRAGSVDDLVMGDAAEVAVGVGLSGDADEDRLPVGGGCLDAQASAELGGVLGQLGVAAAGEASCSELMA
jgi:hypothetical protein